MQRRKGINQTEGKVECKLMSSIHQRDGRGDEIVAVSAEDAGGQSSAAGWRNFQPITAGGELNSRR
jgi:hypothetical protein